MKRQITQADIDSAHEAALLEDLGRDVEYSAWRDRQDRDLHAYYDDVYGGQVSTYGGVR